MSVVLLSDDMPELVYDMLRPYGDVVVAKGVNEEEALCAGAAEAVAIAARAAAPVTARVISAAPGLRVIGRSGVGVDNVDVDAATERGIPVVITPEAGTTAVAEGALALLVTLVKRLPQLHRAVVAGSWTARDRLEIGDLEDVTLGIIGMGRIGTRLAQMATCLGIEVIGHDPFASASPVPLVPLAALQRSANAISLHATLTPQTTGMVDDDFLRGCREGTILVNASRGALVRSMDDLVEGLNRGRLSGVGLDVFEPEPPPADHPLFQDPRVLASPHAFSLTHRATQRLFSDMATGMARVLRGEKPDHVANPQVLVSRSTLQQSEEDIP